jgi:hypothetical protein
MLTVQVIVSMTNVLKRNSNMSLYRQKLYKLKASFEKYEIVESNHNQITECNNADTCYFDHYLEYGPGEIKRLFQMCFFFNRIFMLALIYCVLYNTVWWFDHNYKLTTKSATFISLAINYTMIDYTLLLIIVYINFHDLIVDTLLLRILLFNILKSLHITSTIKLKSVLNHFDALLKLIMICTFFFYFKYSLMYSALFSCFILLPHILCIIYFNYDYEISLFGGCVIFKNSLSSILFEKRIYSPVPADSSQRYVVVLTICG